ADPSASDPESKTLLPGDDAPRGRAAQTRPAAAASAVSFAMTSKPPRRRAPSGMDDEIEPVPERGTAQLAGRGANQPHPRGRIEPAPNRPRPRIGDRHQAMVDPSRGKHRFHMVGRRSVERFLQPPMMKQQGDGHVSEAKAPSQMSARVGTLRQADGRVRETAPVNDPMTRALVPLDRRVG